MEGAAFLDGDDEAFDANLDGGLLDSHGKVVERERERGNPHMGRGTRAGT